MVDWDVMNRAKQIISVLPEQYFLGSLSGENFLAVPWVCLRLVIVVFPDHTNYFW